MMSLNFAASRGSPGVVPQELGFGLARALGLEEATGALVVRVLPDGPADRAGILLKTLTPEFQASPGVEGRHGVVVAGVVPGTAAARTSLQPGDLTRELDRQPVASVEEFSRLARILEKGETALLFVQRGREKFFESIDVAGTRY